MLKSPTIECQCQQQCTLQQIGTIATEMAKHLLLSNGNGFSHSRPVWWQVENLLTHGALEVRLKLLHKLWEQITLVKDNMGVIAWVGLTQVSAHASRS